MESCTAKSYLAHSDYLEDLNTKHLATNPSCEGLASLVVQGGVSAPRDAGKAEVMSSVSQARPQTQR